MIQLIRFSDGGYAIHNVYIKDKKYSAWYDREGKLLDAERVSGGTSFNVPDRHRHVRQELFSVGLRYIIY